MNKNIKLPNYIWYSAGIGHDIVSKEVVRVTEVKFNKLALA